jgi:hemerythrin-like domain-containing protein
MAIQIGAKPDSGFDDPLGMLKDCHRRVEHFLHILCVVAERAAGGPLSDEQAAAVQAALQYFRVGGKRHTADEEESLFPRLRADLSAEFAELSRLESDHRSADDLHAAAENLYSQWIANGQLSSEEKRRLIAATQQLKRLYEAHIQVEENVVFPRAAELLDDKTIATIGQEFRTRRE